MSVMREVLQVCGHGREVWKAERIPEMEKQARFSIIVVCLNAGDKLLQTVESIQKQTYTDYEIVVKDGWSRDGSLERLPADARIQIYRERDTGIYDAMNQAVEKAAGKYVLFLNCGDVFHDNTVLEQADRYIAEDERKNGAGHALIYYGDTYTALTDTVVASNPHMDAFACFRNVPCHQTCFYALKLMQKRAYRPEYKVRADYEHFLWSYFRGNAKPKYMGIIVSDYEGGGFSETKENIRRSKAEHEEIVRKYMTRGQILRYKLILWLTLAPLRTKLAQSKRWSAVYNKLKDVLYRRK